MFRFSSLILIFYLLGAATLVNAYALDDLQAPALPSTAALTVPDGDLQLTVWTRPHQDQTLLVQSGEVRPAAGPIDGVRPAWGWLAAMIVVVMYVLADPQPLLEAILVLPSLF